MLFLFRKGSVVCNFKVNFVLHEGYVAVPFHVTTDNVTEVLDQGFTFQQGVLFQKFIIAAGSYNSASE